jgi:hypothetical protein
MSKSHDWVERERANLRKKYPNKVILVRECEVIKVYDATIDLRKIFEEADKLCEGKDWTWSYIDFGDGEVILWV